LGDGWDEAAGGVYGGVAGRQRPNCVA